MAQVLFAGSSSGTIANLDANFTELYGFAKNLVSDGSGNVQIGAGAATGFRFSVASSSDVLMSKCTGTVGAPCVLLWHTATSGNNTFASFFTEASATGRGTITYNRAGGLVAYNTTSDYRAKTIHGPMTGSGAAIDALAVYSGTMIGATIARPMFIAHEVAAVAPYAVTGEKDAVDEEGAPLLQQMDAGSLVPLLVAELQSVRARLAALEAA